MTDENPPQEESAADSRSATDAHGTPKPAQAAADVPQTGAPAPETATGEPSVGEAPDPEIPPESDQSTTSAPEDPLYREYRERDEKLRVEAQGWNDIAEGVRREWSGLIAETRPSLQDVPAMEIVVKLLDRSDSENFALGEPPPLPEALPVARSEETDEGEAEAKARADRWESLDGLSAAQRAQERAVTRFLKGQVVPVIEAAHRLLRNTEVTEGPRGALGALADACARPALRLERSAPAPDSPFDPETQESMGGEHDPAIPRDRVLRAFGGGYRFRGPDDHPHVLQYAPVEVSLGPKEETDAGQ